MDNNNAKVQASFIEMSRFVKIDPIEKETPRGWVQFGENNMYPEYLIELYNNCSLHNAVINSTSDMVKGQGFNSDPATLMEIERLGFNKELPMLALDLKLHGGVFVEVLWSINHERIAKINHLPTECMRLAVHEDGEICGAWFSRAWADIRKKRNIPTFIPLFDKSNKGELSNREVIYIKRQTPASRVYHTPDYIGGVNWVEMSRQISEYHLNQLLNGFFPSLIASFNNGIPSLEEQHLVKQNLQNTVMGTENAGKVLVFFNEEKERGVEFTPFPITDADKQYQFLSEETTKQLFMAHRVTSPLLFGVRDGGGLGSNSEEMEQALFIYQKQVVEPYQNMLINVVNDVIEVNGFKDKAITIEANDFIMPQSQPITQSSQKKKNEHVCCSSVADFTDEQGSVWIGELTSKGEVIDLEEWELLSEEEVTDPDKEEFIASQHQSLSDYANPDDKSKWGDVGMYKLRYAYSQNLSANSRQFCIDMVALSKSGVVFKYEDIQVMGDDGVNGQFAPEGSSTYNIFKYKGGAFCHHFWKRQIYFRKREKGKFLPNKGLENDVRVGNNPYVPKKGEESIAPINTPSRGSIKYA